MKNIVVVGGGIVGIYAALRARQLCPDSKILLLEQDSRLGGLLCSDLHPSGHYFDRGTHILSSTGNEIIDTLLFQDLDLSEWNEMTGIQRDICGLFFANVIQDKSPFLAAPESSFSTTEYEGQFSNESDHHLQRYLIQRFGEVTARSVFSKPLLNVYQCSLDQLDIFAARQLPLSRIVRDEIEVWLRNCANNRYRELIACPEQEKLPNKYTSALSAWYPKRMGVGQLIDGLCNRLKSSRIDVRLSSNVQQMDFDHDFVNSISFSNSAAEVEVLSDMPTVVWTAPAFGLGKLLLGPQPSQALARPAKSVLVDFYCQLNRRLNCYYYYDYADNPCFRLTNYGAFCQEASSLAFQPFTYELWWRDPDCDPDHIQSVVTKRAHELGLVSSSDQLSDFRIRATNVNIPSATIQNMSHIRDACHKISQVLPKNLMSIGLFSKQDLFFMSEMLLNAELVLSTQLN